MKTFSTTSDIIYLTFSTSLFPEQLDPVIACDPDPTISNSSHTTMTEILSSACFSIHTTTSNKLSQLYLLYYVFHCFSRCQLDAFCHYFNNVLVYLTAVCVCVSDVMVTMGYTRRDIEESLTENKYDSLTATYLLLGRPSFDVTITFWCLPFKAYCCHMGTDIKHPVADRVKPSFVIFDIWALWRSVLSVRVPGCQKLQMTA